MNLFRDARVVAHLARDDEIHVGVVEDVLDTRFQVFQSFQGSVDGLTTCSLQQLVMDVGADEVAQDGEQKRVDLRVELVELDELHHMHEQTVHAHLADFLVVLVETVHSLGIDNLLDVEIRDHRHGDSASVGLGTAMLDLEHTSVFLELEDRFDLLPGTLELVSQLASLGAFGAELEALTHLVNDVVGRLLLVWRQTEFGNITSQGAARHSEFVSDGAWMVFAPHLAELRLAFLLSHGFLLMEP